MKNAFKFGGSMSAHFHQFYQRQFRRADNVVWDMTTGRIGVLSNDSTISSLDGSGEDAVISKNAFTEFGLPIPAFATNTPPDQVKEGDMILFGATEKPGWVIGISKAKKTGSDEETIKFTLLKDDGQQSKWSPPKTKMLGLDTNGVMVLRSLGNLLPGGDKALTSFGTNMMPLMMMMGDGDDSDSTMERLIPMMLMGQMQGGDGGMNPMIMAMMMSKFMGGGSGSAAPAIPAPGGVRQPGGGFTR